MSDRDDPLRASALHAEHECRGTIYQRPTSALFLWCQGDPNVMRKRGVDRVRAEENFSPY